MEEKIEIENYSKEIENFKKEHSLNIEHQITSNRGLGPTVTIFAKPEKNPDPDRRFTVFVMPIPDDFFKSADDKKNIVKVILQSFYKIENEGFKILTYAWSSEVWVRSQHIDEKVDDIHSLPKKEAVFTLYETEKEISFELSDIIREGKIANTEGELIDCIVLKKNKDFSSDVDAPKFAGQFSNLFKKYRELKSEFETEFAKEFQK